MFENSRAVVEDEPQKLWEIRNQIDDDTCLRWMFIEGEQNMRKKKRGDAKANEWASFIKIRKYTVHDGKFWSKMEWKMERRKYLINLIIKVQIAKLEWK